MSANVLFLWPAEGCTDRILSGPRRRKIALNLNEIDKQTKEGDTIIIPGKVLSDGEISKKIAIVAFGFSKKSREKILKTKSQATSMLEEIKKNPNGKGIKVLYGVEK